MGILDKNEGSVFGDESGKPTTGKAGASPDFSDATTGSSTPGARKADFSDVSSGQSTSAPTAGSTGQTYTVKSGDSLSKIAKHVYGDASKWHRIYDANKDKIKNPDLIHPGQEFTIPDA